jgi:hypothetical protein
LCWNNDAEARLVHDATLLSAVGRALALSGRFSTIGVRSEPCAKRMPDAACFGVPGGIMCQAVVIERQLRAASWAVEKYTRAGRPAYEKFRRANAEAVAYGFQFADGARPDAEADRLRASLTAGPPGSNPLVDALADYNLASLLGHELDWRPKSVHALGAQVGLGSVSEVSQDPSSAPTTTRTRPRFCTCA